MSCYWLLKERQNDYNNEEGNNKQWQYVEIIQTKLRSNYHLH